MASADSESRLNLSPMKLWTPRLHSRTDDLQLCRTEPIHSVFLQEIDRERRATRSLRAEKWEVLKAELQIPEWVRPPVPVRALA